MKARILAATLAALWALLAVGCEGEAMRRASGNCIDGSGLAVDAGSDGGDAATDSGADVWQADGSGVGYNPPPTFLGIDLADCVLVGSWSVCCAYEGGRSYVICQQVGAVDWGIAVVVE